MKQCLYLFISLLLCSFSIQLHAQTIEPDSNRAVEALQTWLQKPLEERADTVSEAFASVPLTKEDAQTAKELLWNNYQEQIRAKYRSSWETKQFQHEEFIMKIEYKTFGDKPKDGRSLYISMHGGGNAPAQLNDRQWQNQIGLYEPKEGIYLAPRAPTNEWNLWHLPHIDDLFGQIIQASVVLADVNPNRVYIMGYSAGGDGVFQLAPRMADRLAAAAMMAGHPNETVPLGLRNIGFTLHTGGNDAAYNRNKVAQEWKEQLAALHEQDREGYIHDVQIHEGKGHWMDREDQVAVEWMANFTRNPLPKKVVWKQDDVTHSRFYWLAVNSDNEKVGSLITASLDGQTINIEKTEGVNAVIINLNDDMLDMDQPVKVMYQDHVLFEGGVARTIQTIHKTISERGDYHLNFSGMVEVSFDK